MNAIGPTNLDGKTIPVIDDINDEDDEDDDDDEVNTQPCHLLLLYYDE